MPSPPTTLDNGIKSNIYYLKPNQMIKENANQCPKLTVKHLKQVSFNEKDV